MKFLGAFFLAAGLTCTSFGALAQDPLYREYPSEEDPTAVAVVVHGLNTRPVRMLPLIRFLNLRGVHVFNVSLSGHRFGTDMDFVSPELWKREMKEVFEAAKLRSVEYAVPLNFVGYSLGALAGLRTLQELPGRYIDQAILLAPAISLTKKTQLMRVLAPFRKIDIPSLSPLYYRANWGTSVACYNSLFALKAELFNNSWRNLHFPALVIADPKDELVSWKGLNRIAPQSWEVMPIDNSQSEARTYHHLILDEYVVGKVEWQRMTGAIANSLKLTTTMKREALCDSLSCL